MGRNYFNAFGDFQSRCPGIHDKGADTSCAGILAGAGEHGIEVGYAAVRDPGLLAVDDVIATVFYCGSGQRSDVGTGPGFGQGKCGNHLAVANCGQVIVFLLPGAEQCDGAAAKPLHGESEIRQAGMVRQGLADKT